MPKKHKLITLECELLTETEAAFKLMCNGIGTWVPKSQTLQISETEFEMPEWLAMEKGFI